MDMVSDRYIHKIQDILLLLSIVVFLCMIPGCGYRQASDSYLAEVDSIIEQRPDSALMLLESIQPSPSASDYDRAYYNMLLTYARYKNFIDETNDSVIADAAEYFLEHRESEQASCSLFLKGMIQMNSNRLGQAAVSFKKGLDIAREGSHYMWEGQCARGLFFLFGKLLNSSEQIRYAAEESKAFFKLGCEDWINYAELDLGAAYNNNGQYEDAVAIAVKLRQVAEEKKDTSLLAEANLLLGIANFSLGKRVCSLENYARAYMLDSTILSNANRMHISTMSVDIDPDDLSDGAKHMITVNKGIEDDCSFKVLADMGQYEKAYRNLISYKNMQDSVLSRILHNNVSGELNSYQDIKNKESRLKSSIERSLIYNACLSLLLLAAILIFWYKIKIIKKESEYNKIQAELISLKADFLRQSLVDDTKVQSGHEPVSEKVFSDDAVNEDVYVKSKFEASQFRKQLKDKYAEINEICDDYYQSLSSKRNTDKVKSEIAKTIKTFTSQGSIKKIEEYVDESTDYLYSSFKKDFVGISSDNKKMFLYQMLGFSSLSICVLLNIDKEVLFNRKSRLKKKIMESESERKEEYLSFF